MNHEIEIEFNGHELVAVVEITPAYRSVDYYCPSESADCQIIEVRLCFGGRERPIGFEKGNELESWIARRVEYWWESAEY